MFLDIYTVLYKFDFSIIVISILSQRVMMLVFVSLRFDLCLVT